MNGNLKEDNEPERVTQEGIHRYGFHGLSYAYFMQELARLGDPAALKGRAVAGDKGLLAMDESNPTCNKQFAKLGIPRLRLWISLRKRQGPRDWLASEGFEAWLQRNSGAYADHLNVCTYSL